MINYIRIGMSIILAGFIATGIAVIVYWPIFNMIKSIWS